MMHTLMYGRSNLSLIIVIVNFDPNWKVYVSEVSLWYLAILSQI